MDIPKTTISKSEVFEKIAHDLKEKGFQIIRSDQDRPWGGFFVIDENQTQQFVDTFFDDERNEIAVGKQKLSPKILLVQPQKRLSWQYHHRRTEIWKVIQNKAGVVISETDEQTEVQEKATGDVIRLGKEQRHRLVGLDDWGVIAEIWQHSDPDNPSDEDDIVRVSDDFGR